MADLPLLGKPQRNTRKRPGFLTRMVLSPRFHALAERLPILRGHARAEGRALFAVVAGFVRSQVLVALVDLGILEILAEGPLATEDLVRLSRTPAERLSVLLQAGAALGLIRRDRKGHWHLAVRGAAFLAVPGLGMMVRHHAVLYRDLSDPTAFFRGDTTPELASFWPYVFGALSDSDAGLARRYSQLMSDSQGLVAADTLAVVNLSGRKHLMDVGGGTGAFLSAVRQSHPDLALTLFDLPEVVEAAQNTVPGLKVLGGNFRDGPLPVGADVISLVRVMYDHSDSLVRKLADSVYQALPSGGMILVSEPMSGGDEPDQDTDVYFAVYTMAMQTGRTRSAKEIAQIIDNAGFRAITVHPSRRPFITSVISAVKS